ncbi:MAG: ethanolamine permease [Bacteroidia bacterium]|nr:ethanolamine permease [Bacteroidia bacterium]
MEISENNSGLKKTLSPLMLWGLGVGYVISGMYFGWNLGLEKGGTLGLAIATFFIIILYTCFSFSYAELACAIPKAGGVFDYAKRALGKDLGFIAGVAQIIEFVFAPPAIAFGIGAYFNLFFPGIPVLPISITAYFIFTALNIVGVKAAAIFELFITIIAVVEILIFSGVTLPHFKSENLTHNAFPNGWGGVFAALPFAIWFFLGIEGLANVAEETKNPQRDILRGFGSAIFTLVILCVLVFVAAIGVGGWESIVYKNGISGDTSDSPLPLAMSKIVGNSGFMFHMLLTIGLFGFVASFHGLILAAGRSTFEFGKTGFAPKFLGKINSKFKTPANALLINMAVGIIALCTNKTADIITISVMGALTLYIIAMISLIVLRKKEPDLHRPFKVPGYPATPFLVLILAIICFCAVAYFNLKLSFIYIGLVALSWVLFKVFYKKPTQ